jgi:hypothetical protein
VALLAIFLVVTCNQLTKSDDTFTTEISDDFQPRQTEITTPTNEPAPSTQNEKLDYVEFEYAWVEGNSVNGTSVTLSWVGNEFTLMLENGYEITTTNPALIRDRDGGIIAATIGSTTYYKDQNTLQMLTGGKAPFAGQEPESEQTIQLRSYTVTSEDRKGPAALAERFGMTLGELYYYNPKLRNGDILIPGEVLKVYK